MVWNTRQDMSRIIMSISQSSSMWLGSMVLCDLQSCLTSSNVLNFLRLVTEPCVSGISSYCINALSIVTRHAKV